MNYHWAVVVGSLAAIASTSSFAPQAWKIIRTRETKNISAGMYLLTVVAFALWIGYGVLLGQWPLIVPNTICFLLAAFILTMKFLPRREIEKIADTVDAKPSAE